MDKKRDIINGLLATDKQHRQIIQNFLNMVCFETQGLGGNSELLDEMLELYFEEGEE